MSVFGKVAHRRSLIVVAAALMVSSTAFATALNPAENQWYTHPQVTGVPTYELSAGPTDAANWDLIDTLTKLNDGELKGVTTSKVYRNKTDGTLAFSYSVHADANNTRYIVRATLDGEGWESISVTNAGIVADQNGQTGAVSGTGLAVAEWKNGAPIFIARSEYSPTAPEWQFQIPRVPVQPNDPAIGTVIGPNDDSAEIWFMTNAKAYSTSYIAYLDSGQTGRAEVFMPLIPEPGTMALIGVATGGLAIFRRRRTA